MTQNLLKNLFCSESHVAALAGTFLTVLGLLVIFRNGLTRELEFRWWALFIILPSLLLFGCAWIAAHHQAPYQAGLVLFGIGLIVLTVAAVFLLNLPWERWWPLMLIMPGLPLLLIGLPDSALRQYPQVAAWSNFIGWVGAMMVLLGLTFLANNFHLIDLAAWTQRVGWWGGFILLCAIGAAWNGAGLWMKTGQISLSVLGLGLLAAALCLTAISEWFRLGWHLKLPVWLIASGILLLLYFFLSRPDKALL